MQGKTHLLVGAALSLWILRPQEPAMIAAGAAVGAVGGVISDIDSASSTAGQKAAKLGAGCVGLAILAYFADRYWGFGLYGKVLGQRLEGERTSALLVFLLLCCFGMLSPHRAFLHSVLGGALLTACLRRACPEVAWYFALGFASHLALDLFNRKGIRLWFPSKRKLCTGWFRSDGLVNRLCFLGGAFALGIIVYRLWPR